MQHSKLWFKAKKYGYGWYPCTWQGWMVLVIYTVALITDFKAGDMDSHSVSDSLIYFITHFLSLTILLYIICYLTGEKPKWRWGDMKKDKDSSHT